MLMNGKSCLIPILRRVTETPITVKHTIQIGYSACDFREWYIMENEGEITVEFTT